MAFIKIDIETTDDTAFIHCDGIRYVFNLESLMKDQEWIRWAQSGVQSLQCDISNGQRKERDPWQVKAETWMHSIRYRATGIRDRESERFTDRDLEQSWDARFQRMVLTMARTVKYQQDKWNTWACNLASNMRKRKARCDRKSKRSKAID
jgi:hypothetical protein